MQHGACDAHWGSLKVKVSFIESERILVGAWSAGKQNSMYAKSIKVAH